MALTLIILAGGIGSRFGGEKQKVAFGPYHRSLPEYAMIHAKQAGFEKFILVIQAGQNDEWREFLGERLSKTGINMNHVLLAEQAKPGSEFKRQKPWGTGHALLCGAKKAEGEFMVVNGDDYYGKIAYEIMATELKTKQSNTGVLLPYKLNQTLSPYGTVSRAVCELEAGSHLIAIREMHGLQEPLQINPNTPVSMNCWGFDSSITPALEKLFQNFLLTQPGEEVEFGIPHAIQSMIQQNHLGVKVLAPAEGWFGITYQQDVAIVNQMLNKIEA